jgi:hypothetical protein
LPAKVNSERLTEQAAILRNRIRILTSVRREKEKAAKMLATTGSKPDLMREHRIVRIALQGTRNVKENTGNGMIGNICAPA